jgi:hypothetical protein
MPGPLNPRFEAVDDLRACESTYLEARQQLDEIRLAYRRNPTHRMKEAWWGALETVLQASERRERALRRRADREVEVPGKGGGGDRI